MPQARSSASARRVHGAAAVLGGATARLEDSRANLTRITVPVLVVQGSQDMITPPEATGNRLPGLLRRASHVVIPGGPHAIIWTHADQVNQALLDFIRAP
jgi:non-heme chloroperoxidase